MKSWLQIICVMCVTFGIIMEVYFKANIWYAFITGGALAFAISTKIENAKRKNVK